MDARGGDAERGALLSGGVVRVVYEAAGARTYASRVFESGSLRLRHPRGDSCLGVLLNTGGGILAGDRLSVDVALGPDAAVTLTSAAAEKVYRADDRLSTAHARLSLAENSRLVWAPQETILHDNANFIREFEVDLAASATFIATETIVFGRIAHGEREISGTFRDRWRVRRAGRLVFADDTRIEGAISRSLDRAAVARGARAAALVVFASPDAARYLDDLRATIAAHCEATATPGADVGGGIEGAASLRDGIVLARFTGHSTEKLRNVITVVLATLGCSCGLRT